MKKSTLSLALGALGVLGAIIVWALDNDRGSTAHLQFFGGLALMGGATYVIARLGERR
jgi:hypothetical protein